MPGFSDKNLEFAAKLEDIEDIYNSELSKPAKMAYKLFAKRLKPSSIDKTNVMQADSLFHDSTIAAMKLQKSHLEQTQQIS